LTIHNFFPDLATRNLTEGTKKEYAIKVNTYLTYCRTWNIHPWHRVSVEAYIFMVFKHGNSIACPRTFQSALRKVTDIAGIDDLFSKKANLMINAFTIDEKMK
jgi:hypothetical protein